MLVLSELVDARLTRESESNENGFAVTTLARLGRAVMSGLPRLAQATIANNQTVFAFDLGVVGCVDNYGIGIRIGPLLRLGLCRTSESNMGELRCADSTPGPVCLSMKILIT